MRADRLLSILLLLQTRDRMTARELSDTLNVSERTIYRDLDALNAAGIPVYTERGPGGGCALVEGYRTNLTGLTEAEVRSLFVPGVPGPLADLGLGQVLEEALLKLLVALPSMHRHDAERVRQRFMLDAAGWFQPEEPVPHLHTLQEAVWQDRKMTMVYRRGDGTQTERTVEPYGLVAKASIWYMVAAVEEQIRVYRVSRVQAATLCEERFERPLTFDLAAYWADWCAEFESSRARLPVTLRAAPELVPILPQIFGEGMHAIIADAGPPDAAGWITLCMTFESLEIAARFMLGFGAWAEVLAPPALRARIIETAAQIVDFYTGR